MSSESTFIYDGFQSESSVGSFSETDTTVKVEYFNTNTDSSEEKLVIFYTNCDSMMDKKHELEINKYQSAIVVLTETFPKNIDSRNILLLLDTYRNRKSALKYRQDSRSLHYS